MEDWTQNKHTGITWKILKVTQQDQAIKVLTKFSKYVPRAVGIQDAETVPIVHFFRVKIDMEGGSGFMALWNKRNRPASTILTLSFESVFFRRWASSTTSTSQWIFLPRRAETSGLMHSSGVVTTTVDFQIRRPYSGQKGDKDSKRGEKSRKVRAFFVNTSANYELNLDFFPCISAPS